MSLYNLSKRLEKTINSGITYCFSDFEEKTEKQITKIEKFADGVYFVDKLKNKLAKLAISIIADCDFDHFILLFNLNDIEARLYPQTKDFRNYLENKYCGIVRTKKEASGKIAIYFLAFSSDEKKIVYLKEEAEAKAKAEAEAKAKAEAEAKAKAEAEAKAKAEAEAETKN